jgi:hypothetical protein
MALELASIHLPDFVLILLSLVFHMGHEGTVVVRQAWVVHVIVLRFLEVVLMEEVNPLV